MKIEIIIYTLFNIGMHLAIHEYFWYTIGNIPDTWQQEPIPKHPAAVRISADLYLILCIYVC